MVLITLLIILYLSKDFDTTQNMSDSWAVSSLHGLESWSALSFNTNNAAQYGMIVHLIAREENTSNKTNIHWLLLSPRKRFQKRLDSEIILLKRKVLLARA